MIQMASTQRIKQLEEAIHELITESWHNDFSPPQVVVLQVNML